MARSGTVILMLAAAGMLQAGPARAEDQDAVITLEPSSAWHLDVGEHRCRLARKFGEGDSATLFAIDQWEPSDGAIWMVAGPPVKPFREGRETAFAFGPDGDAGTFDLLGMSFETFGNSVQHFSHFTSAERGEVNPEERDYLADPRSLPVLDAEGAGGVEWLTLNQRGRPTVKLQFGSLRKPLAALNICMANLVERWGFDPEEERRVVSPPIVLNMKKVVDEVVKRYPFSAVNRGAQADFHIRLTVSAEGGIENCVLLNQTVSDNFDLDDHPCAVFKRHAQFEPARDVDGNPVRTYYTNRIVYRVSR